MTEPDVPDAFSPLPGSIPQDTFRPELRGKIRSIYDVLGQFLQLSVEEFELRFRQEADPAAQVNLWMGVTAAWIDYHEEFLADETMSAVDERRLISALVAIASGIDDLSRLGVPAAIGRRLQHCYDALLSELDDDQPAEEEGRPAGD